MGRSRFRYVLSNFYFLVTMLMYSVIRMDPGTDFSTTDCSSFCIILMLSICTTSS